MQTVTASQIKQNSTILQNALKSDMLVTKREKPFVVIVDYDRYKELIVISKNQSQKNWIAKTSGSMRKEDAEDLLLDIQGGRVNKEVDLWS